MWRRILRSGVTDPVSTRTETDVVILGGGHNGLVCAFYLARAGLKVTMLERRGVVGGAAVTEEFHPGFRNYTASYTVSLLNPKIIAYIALALDWQMEGEMDKAFSAIDHIWWQPHLADEVNTTPGQ